jgi:hypothetical protein
LGSVTPEIYGTVQPRVLRWRWQDNCRKPWHVLVHGVFRLQNRGLVYSPAVILPMDGDRQQPAMAVRPENCIEIPLQLFDALAGAS